MLVGDLLDISSTVPLDAQIPVVLQYLQRLAERTATAVCSGNHDLTGLDADGEQAAGWLAKADASSGSSSTTDRSWWATPRSTCTPGGTGPIGRQRLESRLEALAEARRRRTRPAAGSGCTTGRRPTSP